MKSSSLLPLLLVISLSTAEQTSSYQRGLRSFPYSVSFLQRVSPEWDLTSYPSSRDDLAELIDALNRPGGYSRERRSMGGPVKRYACRFKFCRIFDA